MAVLHSVPSNEERGVQCLREECKRRGAFATSATAFQTLKKRLVDALVEKRLKSPIFRDLPGEREIVVRAGRYRNLVRLLTKAGNKNTRQVILTRFACQEASCQPDEVIADEALEFVRKQVERQLQSISPQDYSYSHQVDCWLPFATRLVADYRRARRLNNPEAELLHLGYEDREIGCVRGRRLSRGLATQVACRLIAQDSNVKFTTVQNGHLRVRKRASWQT